MSFRRSLMLLTAAAVVGLAAPGAASARYRMTGHAKATAVFGMYAIGQGNDGDIWNGTVNEPPPAVEQYCFGAFESSVNENWAVVYSTHEASQFCLPYSGDGVEVLNVERWTRDGQTVSYWTPTTAFDETPCLAKPYPGEPAIPVDVIDDLFGVHCPTLKFGNLPSN